MRKSGPTRLPGVKELGIDLPDRKRVVSRLPCLRAAYGPDFCSVGVDESMHFSVKLFGPIQVLSVPSIGWIASSASAAAVMRLPL